MEPINDTHDQRVQNIKWAIAKWVMLNTKEGQS